MSSLNQLISEIAHSVGQPNNYPLKQNIRGIIMHTRNEIIRRSFENHGYLDKAVQYRYTVNLQIVNDGDVTIPEGVDIEVNKIKRTVQKVPRPVRLTNNLPFGRISTVGARFNVSLPFIKETTARFRNAVPGLSGMPCWDYINDYLYIFPSDNSNIADVDKIVIEAAFENPTEVAKLNGDGAEYEFMDDDNEWFLPDDMVGQIKDIIYKRNLLQVRRETNELTNEDIFK